MSNDSDDPHDTAESRTVCVWRVDDDGTRSLLAIPVDREFADRFADEMRARGMTVDVTVEPAPYDPWRDDRLWEAPVPRSWLEEQVGRYRHHFPGHSRASVSTGLDRLPTDEILRMLRQQEQRGAPHDDMLALLSEVLRLRSVVGSTSEYRQRLAHGYSLVAAVLWRLDEDQASRAIEAGGFSPHDWWGSDWPPYDLMDDFIDELVDEALSDERDEPPQ